MFGDLISGGVKLIGGLMGKEDAEDNRKAQQDMAAQNIQLQKDFAQAGIRWKVNDAKEAGIHPLYALGATTHNFSPVSIGNDASSPLGDALSSAGQDIGRAVNSTMTLPERTASLEASMAQTEGVRLDNEIKKTQLASGLQKLGQAQATPPSPSLVGDGSAPFDVPEKNKSEERPPLMLFGRRVNTPSGTSPMKAWEDQIGDDGPLSWLAQLLVGTHMIKENVDRWMLPSRAQFRAKFPWSQSRQQRQR